MNNKQFLTSYLFRFLALFGLFYFGGKALIGITVPGGYYSEFVHDFLNFPRLLRQSLLHGGEMVLSLFGHNAFVHDENYLRIVGGRGVRLVYSCLGLGLLSAWSAFVLANAAPAITRLWWTLGGCFVIWLVNVSRIAFLLLVVNDYHQLPFGLDHHLLYNLVAYAVIFVMGYLYDRKITKLQRTHAVQERKLRHV